MTKVHWITLAVCGWHATAGALLLTSPHPCDITPMHLICASGRENHVVIGAVLLAVTASSIAFMLSHRWWRPLLLIPQFIAIMFSGIDSAYYGLHGRYADGTYVPWQHITSEQSLIVWIAAVYLIVVAKEFRGLRS